MQSIFTQVIVLASLLLIQLHSVVATEPMSDLSKYKSISGIYPHLASFNNQGECGTGALVPWAGKLYWVTYAPHQPKGSDDKLYSLELDGNLKVHPESIGGTPANRMIHRESQQLFIGPYAIDQTGKVRVIPYSVMYGRPTGNARHLTDPANKIYYATMEEGIYEVDVHSLAVKELWQDEQLKGGRHADLPGYHGKGLYSGFGQLIYANNGEHGKDAQKFPFVPSGVLASWDGKADQWNIVRRNQFTEITGPGGIYGNEYPDQDPIWTMGWDHKSLILMCLHEGKWHTYRLPKGSHSYDGAHGWNTEWPRIREVGDGKMLMTMHGTFWDFPKTFTPKSSAGIKPRSNYLKVVGDFCRYVDHIVLGCDDTAKSEFLNTRKLKKGVTGPGQSQSNLRFIKPEELDQMGPLIGRGAVWLNEDVRKGTYSDPYLFTGYETRVLHLSHQGDSTVTISIELDEQGTGDWKQHSIIPLAAKAFISWDFPSTEHAYWVRLKANTDVTKISAQFLFKNKDTRTLAKSHEEAEPTQKSPKQLNAGLLSIRGDDLRTLRLLPEEFSKENPIVYDLNEKLELAPVADLQGGKYMQEKLAYPQDVISVDEASVLYIDEQGKRWRLPKGDPKFDTWMQQGLYRVCREVATERDLLNVHGTFYELPADNAGGFAKIRPVTSHNMFVQDYATYRGLLVMSGVANYFPANDPHIIKSADGKASLWAGSIDDLWLMGKPCGTGGPWKNSAIQQGVPSDPYLLTGYDQKSLTISHNSPNSISFKIEIDITGDGLWVVSNNLDVPANQPLEVSFNDSLQGYWLRLTASADTTATAVFKYE